MEDYPDPKQKMADAIQWLSKFVIPLYVIFRDRPTLIGSGFFVAIGGELALVSAAHVLKKVSGADPLFAYKKPDEMIQIGGKRFLSDPNEIDLGFILTSNLSLPWPEVDKFPCPIECLYGKRVPRSQKHFVIVGYPETKNRANPVDQIIKTEAHAYHADSIPDEEYTKYGLDPTMHVALPLDLKIGYGPNGEHRNFPKPQGMSGSPIWELLGESEPKDQSAFPPIVAVATTYKEKIIFGTDVEALVKRLHAAVEVKASVD